MRIRADEHVSPKTVRIVRKVFKRDELTREILAGDVFELSSVRGAGHQSSSDVHWITEFAGEGGDAILSADTDFFKKPYQVTAIDRTGLKVIQLPSKWANTRLHLQTAHILMWWPRILKKLVEAKAREFWEVPWNINDSGELRRKKVNFSKSHKKFKKSQRRPG